MERWELEYDKNGYPVLWDVSVNSFGERVLVLEDYPGLKEVWPKAKGKDDQKTPKVTLVRPRDTSWTKAFLDGE